MIRLPGGGRWARFVVNKLYAMYCREMSFLERKLGGAWADKDQGFLYTVTTTTTTTTTTTVTSYGKPPKTPKPDDSDDDDDDDDK